MTTTIFLFDEVQLNGSHGAGRSIPLRAVDLDRKIVWNKLALLWGSPLIYAFCWIRGGSAYLEIVQSVSGNFRFFLKSFCENAWKMTQKSLSFAKNDQKRCQFREKLPKKVSFLWKITQKCLIFWKIDPKMSYFCEKLPKLSANPKCFWELRY